MKFINHDLFMNWFSFMIILLISHQSTVIQALPQKDKAEIRFDEERSSSVNQNQVFEYIDNPTLASGLVSGVKSLNQSVDSLMESIFYRIMDQEFPLQMTQNFELVTRYDRTVHDTSFGTYVVVDQFRLGPRFTKDIGSFQNIPIRLGTDSGIDVINITHKSEAAKASYQRSLSHWRYAFNNWFGILPLLTRILPPSFNPLELYDPISYLQTPFLFPTNANEVLELPLGNIRSIGISGGISISTDVLEPELSRIRDELRLNQLEFRLPYAVFKTGTHQLHVLRKSEHIVWLAVTDQNELGHQIEADLRNNFRVFSRLIPMWGGVKAPIFPIDYFISQAKVKRFDELYSFDLRLETAKDAFTQAVSGNFVQANLFSNQETPTGVTKYFNRKRLADEKKEKISRSIFVQHSERKSSLNRAIVTLLYNRQESHSLEVEHNTWDTEWDVLVGAEKARFDSKLVIKVEKDQDEKGDVLYFFDPDDDNPYALMSQLILKDDFLDTRDFQQSVKLIRYFSGLPLNERLPQIPLTAADEVAEYFQKELLMNPMKSHQSIAPTPIHLGKMQVHAKIYFPYSFLKEMIKKDERQIRLAVAQAFDDQSERWDSNSNPDSFLYWTYKGLSYVLRPLRLLNIRLSSIDLINEQERLIGAMKELKLSKTPIDFAKSFERLLDTSYPSQLIHALSRLGPEQELSKNVEFTCNSNQNAQDSEDQKKAKKLFQNLNSLVIQSGPTFPQPVAQEAVQDKLFAFSPNRSPLSFASPKLLALKAAIVHDNQGYPRLKFTLEVEPSRPPSQPLQFYFRMTQSGSVNIGRFILAEKVAITPYDQKKLPHILEYVVELTNNDAVLSSFFFDRALRNGGDFDLFISLSHDGEYWSPERKVIFQLQPGGHIIFK